MKFRKIYDLIRQMRFDDDSYRLVECDILFLCHDVDRSVTLEGKAYSPLLDSVRECFEQLGLKCQSVAHPFSILTGKKGYGDPVSINRSYITDLIARKLLSNERWRIVGKWIGLYDKVLCRAKPKLIITIGSPPDLCLASRNRNCICVELLHGFTHTELPDLWDRPEQHIQELPDGILSLSELSTNIYAPVTECGVELKTIPHPFLKRFVSEHSTSIPKEWSLDDENEIVFRKEILVSLMWGYAGDHGSNHELKGILSNGLFYEELADSISESRDILWRFRLHPVQLREEKYHNLRRFMDDFISKNANTEWRQSSSLPFPSVAVRCSANISMASGSCYDAASVGLRSLMLCPTLQAGGIHEDYFPDLVEEGYVVKQLVNKEMILSWVNNTEKMQPRLSNLNDEESWKDAVDWMLSSSGLDSKCNSYDV